MTIQSCQFKGLCPLNPTKGLEVLWKPELWGELERLALESSTFYSFPLHNLYLFFLDFFLQKFVDNVGRCLPFGFFHDLAY